ncbi:hypothetical protein [Protofrankia coriariae]|uniref:hypothetical protein n=1 Tax=Protofrankia coriariae TaxID=1562887 RepID=UPI000A322DCA|nr:hypothetical protein [Protofrankia coriariae]
MYGWIFRHLPGGSAAKAVLMVLLVLVVAGVLLFVVFPAVESRLPFTDVVVGQ